MCTSAIKQIALNTYRESLRGKILYSLLFFAGALLLITALLSSVTLGDQVKIIKDIGLMSVSLFAVALSVLAGATLLNKELNKKTIYNILAKPVSRWEFIVGKHLGLMLTISVMILLMTVGLILFSYLFDAEIDLLLLQGAVFIFFELLIVTAYALLFSSIVVTPLLSGLFTFSVFVAGRSIEFIPSLIANTNNEISSLILKTIYWLLPHLDKLNLINQLVYGQGATLNQLFYGALYSISYASIILILSSIIFQRRDFN